MSKVTIFIYLIVSLLGIYIYLPLGILILSVLFFFIFLLRKKNFLKSSLEQWSSKIFLSPVSGKVLKIINGKNLEVYINIRLLSGWGVYLPIKSRVLHFGRKNKKRNFLPFFGTKNIKKLENISYTLLEFEAHNFFYHYHFWNKNLFSDVILNVDNGDIGHSGACLGLFYGGGIVKIVLPSNFKVLVEEGMQIKAVKTLIAKL